ncbi:DUF3817 domain-containing protein [Pseudonocardia nematodicida]|uniref:DUF3817 domain-containing protein n=1 Tax=Pseudonocardia nematodicida TaxID=1206997 RepID=A0ABV1KCK1_9PSEU
MTGPGAGRSFPGGAESEDELALEPDEHALPTRLLRVAAWVEVLSLGTLLVNLATVHHPAVASVTGPIHGLAYLVVIASTWILPCAARTRLLAWVPAVGGLLVVRAVDRTSGEQGVDGRAVQRWRP